MKAGVFTLLVAGIVPAVGMVGGGSAAIHPPSSIEPSPEPRSSKRAVGVSHRSQRIRKCDAVKTGDALSCNPQFEDTDSATAVTFRQAALPDSTTGGAREAVVVAFPDHVGLQELNTELALGQWDVEWRGERGLKRLQVSAHSELSVALRTTSGRCERRDGECRLVGGVIARHVAVTDHGH